MDRLRQLVAPLLLVVSTTNGRPALAATPTPLDDAVALQLEGRNQEAQSALRALLPGLRAASDREALARALSALAEASIGVGDYEAAIPLAQEAFELHQQLGQHGDVAWDLNAVGLANLYLGRYDAALASYEQALALDRAGRDGDGEVMRLNNIGNVHYMRGRYADALRLYDEAMGHVETRTSADARERLRKMTIANLAVLHQRLGAFQRALDLYGQMQTSEVMEPSEEAQLLANQGTLLRRLGDPIKALQTYRQAQALFAQAQHSDGEIGTWRNIGIAYALDLDDSPRALEAFDTALKLARQSSNQRGEVLALLYRGETLRRLGLWSEASENFQAALAGATAVGLVEEQWKALYGLGRIAEVDGQNEEAARSYERAIAAIESVRADLQAVPSGPSSWPTSATSTTRSSHCA